MSFRNLAFVMTGGALGSGARWLVAVFAEKQLPQSFPWGTFFVNVLGSALLGAILALTLGEQPRLSPEARLFLGTGVMGGFTTYSTFNAEVMKALMDGTPTKAVIYASATVGVCLFSAWAAFAALRP